MTPNDSPAPQNADAARPRTYPGTVIRTAGDYAWRLLVVGTVGYFVIHLLSKLSLVIIPFIVSLLTTALLHPLLVRLRRAGLSRWLATLTTVLTAIILVGGLITVVVIRAANQAPQLGNEINSLIPRVKHWLITGPLHLNPTTVNHLGNTLTKDVTSNSSAIASTAVSTGKTVAEVAAGIALTIFSTIFLLYDGDRIWSFLLKGAPKASRRTVDVAAHAAWRTVSQYVRGTLIVASFHGIVVASTLAILGVPLAFPLGVLVGLGSFVPLVGAFVTGALAVAVAGLSKGLLAAIVVLAVLLLDNQIEAHVLQPFVVGRYVRIHPLAVVLALGTGAVLFGIFGAIVAVPVVACVNSAVRAVLQSRDQPSEGDLIPSTG
jgi:predicted PurR-regulated permease PerM